MPSTCFVAAIFMPVIVNDWYTRVSFVASEVSYNIGAVNERERERERERARERAT